jgi:cytochrome c-type biogenesis protein
MDSAVNYSRQPAPAVGRFSVFLHSLLFVLGFSFIFVVGWGGAATLLGEIFTLYKPLLAKAGGVVIILFGLANLGLVRIPWLMYDTRPQWGQEGQKKGYAASGMLGVFFAAGILTLAVSQETSGLALVLSGAYALGLGIPFLLIGLSMERAVRLVKRFRKSVRWIQKVSGVFLIAIGVMMLTNQIFLISIWAQRNGLFLDLPLGGATAPTLAIALAAGLISFLSPCVLPLVPAYVGYLSGHALREPQGDPIG